MKNQDIEAWECQTLMIVWYFYGFDVSRLVKCKLVILFENQMRIEWSRDRRLRKFCAYQRKILCFSFFCQPEYNNACLPVCASVCLSLYPTACLPICLSICFPVYLACLSVWHSVLLHTLTNPRSNTHAHYCTTHNFTCSHWLDHILEMDQDLHHWRPSLQRGPRHAERTGKKHEHISPMWNYVLHVSEIHVDFTTVTH